MFRLDDSLGFLLNRAAFAARWALEERLAEFDLTAPQWSVLCRLWEQDQPPLSTLGRALHLDKPTVSGIVDRMVKKKLVRRYRDASDRRVVRVRLTDSGRKLEAKLVPLARDVNQLAVKGLGAEGIDALKGALAAVATNLGW
jgi:DNA-binding MarR family transcriptional regulator